MLLILTTNMTMAMRQITKENTREKGKGNRRQPTLQTSTNSLLRVLWLQKRQPWTSTTVLPLYRS